jgi:hypothetical protein
VYSSFFYYKLQQSTFEAGKHFLWTLSYILPCVQVLMKTKYRDEQVRYLEQCSRTANLPRGLHLPPIQGIGTRLNQLNLRVGRTQTFGFWVYNCNVSIINRSVKLKLLNLNWRAKTLKIGLHSTPSSASSWNSMLHRFVFESTL